MRPVWASREREMGVRLGSRYFGSLILYIYVASLGSVQACEVTSGPPADVPEFGGVPVGMVGLIVLGLVCGGGDEAKG